MNWYYVDQGQQAGPVDDAGLDELRANRRIQPNTLVWREGMSNWAPYDQARGGAPATTPVLPASPQAATSAATLPPGEVRCAECGKTFPVDQTIRYGDSRICAGCKPVFMQKISEGAITGARRGRRSLPVDPDQLLDEITARGYQVNIGDCISRGWETLKANYWLCVGATFLVMLCAQAAGSIPFLNIVLAIIAQGPLMGGLNLFFIKMIRGEAPGLSDAFSGFSRHFWRLVGTMVLMMVFIYSWFIPVGAYAVIRADQVEILTDLGFWALFLVGGLGAMYCGVAMIFGLFLCADLELGPWQSLRVSWRAVNRRWFSVFALTLVAGILSALGIIGCFVGIIFTMPIFYVVMAHAYEDIFGVGPAQA